jgi:F0F1-type ATP synthase assembly protein I
MIIWDWRLKKKEKRKKKKEKIKKKKEKRKKKKEKRKKELVAKHTRCEHLLQLHVGGLLHNYGTMILTTNSPLFISAHLQLTQPNYKMHTT